jgi:hypothetical protein
MDGWMDGWIDGPIRFLQTPQNSKASSSHLFWAVVNAQPKSFLSPKVTKNCEAMNEKLI